MPTGLVSVGVRLRLELDLCQMAGDERQAFLEEMGLEGFDRDRLMRTLMDLSQQLLFFTAGDKEVRTWLLRNGETALDAAAGVHTDMARGFIRAETISSEDLIRCGSEREAKAQEMIAKVRRIHTKHRLGSVGI